MGLLGGIIGGIIGSMFGGPWGAAIGAGIGYTLGNQTDTSSSPDKPSPALVSLFRALGKIAKADGVVSQEEAAFVSELIREFGKDDSDLRTALKRQFDRGKSPEVSFAAEVRKLDALLTPDIKRSIMEIFCALARVDDVLTDAEKSLLLEAETIFGLRGFVDNFFNGSRQQRGAETRSSGGSLADAYKTLGIAPSASDAEVKAAWHKKTKEFHPDRLSGKGLSEKFIEFAEEEMKKVNLAYETIMQSRK